MKNDHEEQNSSSVSVLKGDEFCISRILAREASKGQSSRIFYRSAEGVPFKWETGPGTPKNPQEADHIFPLSPSPLMQSIGLPLPNVDDHDHKTKKPRLKVAIITRLRKMAKKNYISDIRKKMEILGGSWRSKQQKGSVKGSSFSSNSSFSAFSSNDCVVQYSGPLDNEHTKVVIPFWWEIQPGIPKNLPENKPLPPLSPPPAVHSLDLPLPRQHDGGQTSKDYSSLSSVDSKSRGTWEVVKTGGRVYGSYLGCNPWSIRDAFVARRKHKSFIS
ncbi:hypothetical protein CASFOL_027175 [Castilleja foliolosa]|uniref:Uncharacterized protein n=1 Tax=Castilleja foliolosa TaxID=1961234 RepID=A0ABD3CFR2_9LAMI